MKFLAASFMMLKVKRWTAMSDSNNKIKPIFRSTFDPLTDGDGFLINQKDLISQEVSGNSLLVLRTSSSSKNNTKVAKDLFNLKLPDVLQMTTGDNDSQCFWVSPDEFWVLIKHNHKIEIEGKLSSLPKGISISDNSGAYGILEFTGSQTNNLLARWMSYDIESSLKDGKAVSTTLGQAPVFVYRDKQSLFMMVRHSFSHYVAGLLKDSAKRL